MRVGVTGSSGLIGTALTGHLARSGHVVVPIVRNEAAADQIAWDPADGVLDPGDLRRLDAVVHLAGAGIGDRRWTDDRKRTILESRVAGTRLIAEAMASADGPSILLSGSAIGYYGDRGDEIVDESSRSGNGFLADVCVEWERSTRVAEEAGIRVAHLRTGIVLSRRGGALKKMLPLFKIGLGGRFGAGTQWMSWISIVDEVRAIEYLLTSERSIGQQRRIGVSLEILFGEFALEAFLIEKRSSVKPSLAVDGRQAEFGRGGVGEQAPALRAARDLGVELLDHRKAAELAFDAVVEAVMIGIATDEARLTDVVEVLDAFDDLDREGKASQPGSSVHSILQVEVDR
jgi:uncharacterized protein (TIGR01777 family)